MSPDLPRSVTVQWPAAPLIEEWTGSRFDVAWIRYKMKSADWYIGTLAELGRHLPDYNRYAGVEMAIDGALGALSSAFDAASGTLIDLAEAHLQRKLDRSQNRSWKQCVEALGLLDSAGLAVGTLDKDIAAAFDGQRAESPQGWLARLKRLRNGPMHRQTLGRQFSATVNEPATVVHRDQPVLIHIPGDKSQDPLDYLSKARDQVSALTESMIEVILAISPEQGKAAGRAGTT